MERFYKQVGFLSIRLDLIKYIILITSFETLKFQKNHVKWK